MFTHVYVRGTKDPANWYWILTVAGDHRAFYSDSKYRVVVSGSQHGGGKIVDSVMPEWVKAQMRTVLDKVNKVEQSGPVIHGLGGQWRNDPRMSADNKIRDIAKVLTEDIRINNGLILESHFDYMQILQIRNLIKSGNFPEEVMKTRIDINSDPPDSGPKRELWYDEVQRISRIRDALRNEAFSLGNLDIDTNEFIFPPENEERIKFLLGKANELEKMYPNMFAEWGEHGRLD